MTTRYMLRTTSPDGTSHGGFVWPESGPVSAPDWKPTANCGNGLHGLLDGVGAGSLLSWEPNARWLVVAVDDATVVDLGGKVKVPSGEVVFCGDRLGATAWLTEHGSAHLPVVGAVRSAGYRGTATAGHGGTATAGHGGTATAGDRGVLSIIFYDKARGLYIPKIATTDGDLTPGLAYRLDDAGLFVPVVTS